MAKMTVEGMGLFSTQLNKLAHEVHKINRGALGEAAGMVADRFSDSIDAIPIRDESTHPHRLVGATADELSQIKENFGISRFRDGSGGPSTSIGFTGYVNTPSKRFNDNVPTGMLVQCINYGTDFRNGTHTLDWINNSIKGEVEKTIQDYIDKEVKNIIT